MQFTPPQYCSPCQDPCQAKVVGSDQVGYTGPNLPCTNVQTCDSLSVALQKIDEQICDLQSTVISLQQQINALTTTTTTTTTTTVYNFLILASLTIEAACIGAPLYVYTNTLTITTGVVLYVNSSLTTPAVGYNYVVIPDTGQIYTIDPVTATIGTYTSSDCP